MVSTFYEHRHRSIDGFVSENLTFYPHIHGHVELVYVQQGALQMTIAEHTKTLVPGELAIVFPNTVHSYHTPQSSQARLLIFSADIIGDFSELLNNSKPVSPFIPPQKIHADAYAALGALEQFEALTPNGLVRGYLLVCIGRLLEQLRCTKLLTLGNQDLLRRVLLYLEDHHHENLSLDQVAEALQVSKYTLSRCFSDRIHCGFCGYLNALRASHAQSLLVSTDMSITEVCFEVGFNCLSTFYRAFATSFGMSPKELKSQSQS